MMRFLRTPVVALVVALGLTVFTFYTYVTFWLDHPSFLGGSLTDVLGVAAFLSALFIVVAVGSAIAAVRRHNAPMPGPVVGLIVIGLVVGLVSMILFSLATG
jgi:uncharacterized membrane protein